jgi:transcriptional antiterminator RfaH
MPNLYDCELGWYALKASPKKEHLAAQLLGRTMEMEAFCPRLRYTKRTKRGPVKFVEALFPGYLFVRTELKDNYRRIMATGGVTGLVRYGENVPAVPDAFIEQLRERLDGDIQEEPEVVLEPGQAVTIVEGPFKDWNAVVSGLVPARDRVAILLDFLGQTLELKVTPESLMIDPEVGKS